MRKKLIWALVALFVASMVFAMSAHAVEPITYDGQQGYFFTDSEGRKALEAIKERDAAQKESAAYKAAFENANAQLAVAVRKADLYGKIALATGLTTVALTLVLILSHK